MSAVDDILAEIPLGHLASRLGVDEATAERAARQALPALLGGIQANTGDPDGASSFSRAVQQHDGALVEGGVDVDEIDAVDGDKIVQNVFGQQRPEVVKQLGGIDGTGGNALIARLLPLLAPIVMSYLAQRLGGAGGSAAGGSAAGSAGGGIADILGQILGGASGAPDRDGGGAADRDADRAAPRANGAGRDEGAASSPASPPAPAGSGRGGILGGALGDLLGGLLGGGRRR